MSTQRSPSWFGAPIGRGRGVLAPIFLSVDSPTPSSVMPSLDEIPGARVHNPVNHHASTPIPHLMLTSVSTSHSSECVAAQMRSVMQKIGHQLADSILSRMQPHKTVVSSSTASQTVVSTVSQSSCVSDVSQVHVVMQRKVKEPPCFASNSSDSITVHLLGRSDENVH
ncbi:hypothetical protein ILYODFUR_004223 [Ilyodon furcidens]|uniref:Uncharacterized protein n=1 Tax=Ilyodon furcidens TaxID=33524 RepID=A0ABV0USV1_9TELE